MANEEKVKLQGVKFLIFECSAGVIQFLSFTLMNEVIIKLDFFQNLMDTNPGFARIMQNEYGPMYLIALFLSVCWSFTFNRKITFKSASNVPIAMLEVLAYYAVFTPISTIIGNHFTAGGGELIKYVVLIITMMCNMITEFLWEKYFVFRDALHRGEEKAEDTAE